MKKTILTFADCYLPGYKFGGPVRTLSNMVEQLSGDFSFKILTRDRDWASDSPYEDIRIDQWNRVGQAEVHYLSPRRWTLKGLAHVARSVDYDMIYMNSFFSPVFTIKPLILRRLRRLRPVPAILAPRGELLPEPGHLYSKRFKKEAYLFLARILGLYKGVSFQASATPERDAAIRLGFTDVHVALNLPSPAGDFEMAAKPQKTTGQLKLVFLSRVSREKNLHGAIHMLRDLVGDVDFHIYGPVKDKKYWSECEAIIHELPSTIRVTYRGSVHPNQVRKTLTQYHAFLFPTNGESFGHVIHEALLSGCPVIISDRTPWGNFANTGGGWDLPLSDQERFRRTIQHLIDSSNADYRILSGQARARGVACSQNPEPLEANRRLFLNSGATATPAKR